MMKKMSKVQLEKMYQELRDANAKEDRKQARKLLKEKIRLDLSSPNKESNDVAKALSQMIGATIVDAGFIGASEGGLTFDFIKKSDAGSGKKYRLVIGYNDLGEWVNCFEQI